MILAALAETMTWTQKQLVGFAFVGLLLLFAGRELYRRHQWVGVAAVVAVLFWLGRGIGHGGP